MWGKFGLAQLLDRLKANVPRAAPAPIESKDFTCPDCGFLYAAYFDGHDCACGKIDLCDTCFRLRHRAHDGRADAR